MGNPITTPLIRKIATTVDPQELETLWREAGDAAYDLYLHLLLLWLPAEAVYNPDIIAGYDFPGSITGTWTHIPTIKAAQ